ncbi:MAG: hypothetical protein COT31_02375 [Candidatus Moranbacteria bacterium CG08_land_8_20_14_0_20_34_16]|nr:MAG: hypothetical protein COT31_02375 [Candidatus Moranbacteria bacterium CG08_land_8_20_14_0_20_34_16]
METFNQKIEHEPASKDISEEFKNMPWHEFLDFLRAQRKEPALSIAIDWVDVPTARRLKAFLEDFSALGKQKRSATIRATEEQHNQEMNVFASGVKWEKV